MLRLASRLVASGRQQWAGAAFSTSAETSLDITDACVRKLHQIRRQPGSEDSVLRVVVERGGCSGLSYAFKLDKRGDDDLVFSKDGAEIVTDAFSWEFLKNSTIDFDDKEIIRAAFCVKKNPNSAGGCGCGVSFTPRE